MACIKISDPSTSTQAKVSTRGQLIVAPLDFSDPIAKTITCVCTAVNFFTPKAGKQLVVTDIFIHTNRTIGVNGAVMDIYEADSATSLVEDKLILRADVSKQSSVVYTGLNFLITKGVWLNVKTDDTTVFFTIAGYYIDI